MDPVELRLKNALRDGDLMSFGTPVPSRVSVVNVSKQHAEVT